jgi:hypothetical protein
MSGKVGFGGSNMPMNEAGHLNLSAQLLFVLS